MNREVGSHNSFSYYITKKSPIFEKKNRGFKWTVAPQAKKRRGLRIKARGQMEKGNVQWVEDSEGKEGKSSTHM